MRGEDRPRRGIRGGCSVDHPRMRGEDSRSAFMTDNPLGSPPHARGRLLLALCYGHFYRITPACAGKTNVQRRGRVVRFGSPPHARGRRPPRLRPVQSPGITPACAGKTNEVVGKDKILPDHPRMRGEDATGLFVALSCGGSPPHARGRLGDGAGDRPRDGITPACAGKTRFHDRRPG